MVIRLFVALEIPDEIRNRFADLIAQLKPKCPAAKWVRPESLHVTLKFIGQAREEKLSVIKSSLATIHSPRPIDMHFGGLGFFPSEKHPRVFWCGAEISPNAAPLAAEIDRALETLGIPLETREFKPHLTLARLNSEDRHPPSRSQECLVAITAAAGQSASKSFGATRTSEFHLFESKLKPSGAEYICLQTFRFAEATS
jgi:RNA 2',3'-cyclic 3'-phosphodiesterase